MKNKEYTINSLIHSFEWVNDTTMIELNIDSEYDTTNIFYGSVNDLYTRFGYKTLDATKIYSVLCAQDLNTLSLGIKLF